MAIFKTLCVALLRRDARVFSCPASGTPQSPRPLRSKGRTNVLCAAEEATADPHPPHVVGWHGFDRALQRVSAGSQSLGIIRDEPFVCLRYLTAISVRHLGPPVYLTSPRPVPYPACRHVFCVLMTNHRPCGSYCPESRFSAPHVGPLEHKRSEATALGPCYSVDPDGYSVATHCTYLTIASLHSPNADIEGFAGPLRK